MQTDFIKLVNIRVDYSGKEVLKNINFSVSRGESIALLGPSGSGKSTILRLIIGLQRQSSGDIFIDGVNLSSLNEKQINELHKNMGMVFQYSALFDFLSVKENVAFGLRQHTTLTDEQINDKANQLLKMVGLAQMGDMMPNELSGGMKKRVSLARAIATNPQIVLYDEPTAGLDPIKATVINRLMLDVQKEFNTTSIVVTHDIESALVATKRIILLYEGEIVVDMPTKDIFNCKDKILQQFIYGWDDMRVQSSKERLQNEII